MEQSDSSSSPSPSPSTSSPAASKAPRATRLRKHIDGNAANRLAFISGQLKDLPPPPEPKKEVVAPSPPPSSSSTDPFSSHPLFSQSSSTASASTPPPVSKPWHSRAAYFFSFVIATLLVTNSLNIFPHHQDLNDIKPLSYAYLVTMLLTLLILMNRRITTVLWHMCLVVFLWVGSSELINIVTLRQSVSESNIAWITFFCFGFEFGVSFLKSFNLIKGLLGFAPGPMLWLIHNFLRMILTTLFVIIYPITNLSVLEMPNWSYFTGGVVAWGWLSMVVGAKVTSKLVNK